MRRPVDGVYDGWETWRCLLRAGESRRKPWEIVVQAHFVGWRTVRVKGFRTEHEARQWASDFLASKVPPEWRYDGHETITESTEQLVRDERSARE